MCFAIKLETIYEKLGLFVTCPIFTKKHRLANNKENKQNPSDAAVFILNEMRFKPKQIFLLTIYALLAKETLKILFKEERWSPGGSNKANSGSLFPLFKNMTSLTTESESVTKVTKPFMGALCKRKDHVVYIKTHKTGSTTLAHIFWR